MVWGTYYSAATNNGNITFGMDRSLTTGNKSIS